MTLNRLEIVAMSNEYTGPTLDPLEIWKSRGYCGAQTPSGLIDGLQIMPYCKHKAGHLQHEDPHGNTWTDDTRPCPVCGEFCSGCLEDLAARQEGLRDLLSYCKSRSEQETLDYPERGAYGDVYDKLSPLLDGEA